MLALYAFMPIIASLEAISGEYYVHAQFLTGIYLTISELTLAVPLSTYPYFVAIATGIWVQSIHKLQV